MSKKPLHYCAITELGSMLRTGEITPTKLTEYFINRIENLNGSLTAFNLVTAERAMAAAEAMEALMKSGHDLGPLQGIPYGVKDLYDVIGLPTSAGSKTVDMTAKVTESEVTKRLAAAGMIVLGKTITVEFAKGIIGINNIQGTPHNPWSEEHHLPGGSSAGTAVAVGSGMVPMGLGTDTAGSVRAPAGLSGTVGLKSTVGRVSRFGIFPLSWTFDSVGPLTRSVEDAAIIFQILQGEDARDESTSGIRPVDVMRDLKSGANGLRIGIPEDVFFDDLDPEVDAAVRKAADVFIDLGATVTNFSYPEATAAADMGLVINGVESALIHEDRVKNQADQMDPVVGPRMIDEVNILAMDYVKQLDEIKRLRSTQKETLRDIDIILTPTTRLPALPVSTVNASLDVYLDYAGKYMANTVIGNRLGLCGLTLTCGFTAKGLPIGLLLNGKPFQEASVLRAAFAYEQATDWKDARPDLSWMATADS